MHSLFEHPFISYILVLSSILALLTAIVLRATPARGTHRAWLSVVPLVAPVVLYAVNYAIIGRTCGISHGYTGFSRGFPPYHFLCQLNYRFLPWIAPISLGWLAISLIIYAGALYRTHWLLRHLPVIDDGIARPRTLLSELCIPAGLRPPRIELIDYPKPLMFVAGIVHRSIIVSTGTLALLEDDELKAALAHELAHIQRMGHILNWVFLLCRCVTLFSPASLWSYITFRNEEERICDTIAVSKTGLDVDLASAILKFIRHGGHVRWAPVLTSLFPRNDPGIGRVKDLLSAPVADRRHLAWAFISLVALFISLLFVC